MSLKRYINSKNTRIHGLNMGSNSFIRSYLCNIAVLHTKLGCQIVYTIIIAKFVLRLAFINSHVACFVYNPRIHFNYALLRTVIILNIGTDRSEQTVQTQIRLLLMEQSDQSLLCLLFCLHLLSTILHCKTQLFQL